MMIKYINSEFLLSAILTENIEDYILVTVLYNIVTDWEEHVAKSIEGVSEKILDCAKKEFLENGYMEASLRTIASEAGTTTGSIYSRYGGKEGLFSAIVEPVAKEFTDIFVGVQEQFKEKNPQEQTESLSDFAQMGMQKLVDYMYDHLIEFKILVNSAYGTRFQNFVDHLVEIETDYTYKFMEATGLKFKDGQNMTKEFMHIMNTALFESFFEVVRHNMSKEETKTYIDMLEKYHNAGWSVIYGECR